MQRLQEQRTNPPDEHRRIGMDTPDRILLTKPTLAGAPDLGVLRLEITGNPVPHGFRNGGTRLGECPDHHIAERMRLRQRKPRLEVGRLKPVAAGPKSLAGPCWRPERESTSPHRPPAQIRRTE
jgi:hypothetical protein